MEVRRTTLISLKTGLIESVTDGVLTRLEFNCDCIDAVSVCRAACCRTKTGYSVELEPEEFGRFLSTPHPTRPGIEILQKKVDGLSCIYLDDRTSLCTIHERRPQMCRRWHCSPDGQKQDGEIEVRDAGWLLTPLRKEEAEAVLLQLSKE